MPEAPEDSPASATPPRKKFPFWLRPLLMVFAPAIILAAIILVVRPIILEMVQPPPRLLAPPPAVRAPGAERTPRDASATTPRANDSALINAFGAGAIGLVSRDIARSATASTDALACGLRDARWVSDLRTAAVADIARRTHSYDGKPDDATLLRRFLIDRFNTAQQAGAHTDAQAVMPDRAQRCAELPTLQDFRAADSLVRTHRATPR